MNEYEYGCVPSLSSLDISLYWRSETSVRVGAEALRVASNLLDAIYDGKVQGGGVAAIAGNGNHIWASSNAIDDCN